VVVHFDICLAHRFGGPNDEVMAGHPLYGRGLAGYDAHLVERSSWVAEQQKINSVHSQYDPERWKSWKHYLFVFHDEMFECIAEGHRIERMRCSFKDALLHCTAAVIE
jgi:hypothetical protein